MLTPKESNRITELESKNSLTAQENVELAQLKKSSVAPPKLASAYRIDVMPNGDGSANAVAVPVDSDGIEAALPNGTSAPQWSTSNPNALVAVPHWDVVDGFTAHLSPANPPNAAGGMTVTARSTYAFPATGPETAISGTSARLEVDGTRGGGFKVAIVPASDQKHRHYDARYDPNSPAYLGNDDVRYRSYEPTDKPGAPDRPPKHNVII
jgi:hypothetical protein